MSRTFPKLSTPRLVLRDLKDADDEFLFQVRSNDEVNKYIDRKKAQNIDDARFHMERIRKDWEAAKGFYWVMEERNSNSAMGSVCLWNINLAEMEAELGYELLPDYQGKGYMNEAIASVLDYATSEAQFKRLTAWTHVDNERSKILLLKHKFTRDQDEEKKFKAEELGECEIYIREL
jgi:ribosomal-protein-alanine N-acetyltransferase